MIEKYKDVACNAGVSLLLVCGLAMGSIACKSANCTFFLSSILLISAMQALGSLGCMIRAKARVTLMSVYIGVISALIDVMVVFVYTKVLCTNSLFFCLAFMMYQVTATVLACFVPFASSAFMIWICITFLCPLFELWFAEEHGFPRIQVPSFAKDYVVDGSMNTIYFIPIVGVRVVFGELFGRLEAKEPSALFNSLAMLGIGGVLALVDTPMLADEMSRIDQAALPLVGSNVALAGALVASRWGRGITLTSVYPSLSVLFTIASTMFCSSSIPWLWKKTIVEESLGAAYMFYLVTFSVFVLYIVAVHKDMIGLRPCRDGFVPGMISSFWGWDMSR